MHCIVLRYLRTRKFTAKRQLAIARISPAADSTNILGIITQF
jgi:hypothetical protein